MATGKQLTEQIHDQFLVCKICFEIYKSPKTLSCLHTFCVDCLRKHQDAEYERTYRYSVYNAQVTCPICRKRTELPKGGVRRLPDNFLVANLADVVIRRRPYKQFQECEICMVDSSNHAPRQAVSKCLDCCKLLCKRCVELHRATKVTKGHSLLTVEREREIECRTHPDEVVRFYCEPCEQCVCVVCTFQAHKGHEVGSFAEGLQKYRDSLDKLLVVCRQRIAEVKEHLGVISRCETSLKHAEDDIRDMAIDSISDIRRKERETMSVLRDVYGSDALSFLQQKQPLQERLETLQNTCSLTDVVARDQNVELLLLKREIEGKINDLLEKEVCAPPASLRQQVRFMPGSIHFGSLAVSGAVSGEGVEGGGVTDTGNTDYLPAIHISLRTANTNTAITDNNSLLSPTDSCIDTDNNVTAVRASSIQCAVVKSKETQTPGRALHERGTSPLSGPVRAVHSRATMTLIEDSGLNTGSGLLSVELCAQEGLKTPQELHNAYNNTLRNMLTNGQNALSNGLATVARQTAEVSTDTVGLIVVQDEGVITPLCYVTTMSAHTNTEVKVTSRETCTDSVTSRDLGCSALTFTLTSKQVGTEPVAVCDVSVNNVPVVCEQHVNTERIRLVDACHGISDVRAFDIGVNTTVSGDFKASMHSPVSLTGQDMINVNQRSLSTSASGINSQGQMDTIPRTLNEESKHKDALDVDYTSDSLSETLEPVAKKSRLCESCAVQTDVSIPTTLPASLSDTLSDTPTSPNPSCATRHPALTDLSALWALLDRKLVCLVNSPLSSRAPSPTQGSVTPAACDSSGHVGDHVGEERARASSEESFASAKELTTDNIEDDFSNYVTNNNNEGGHFDLKLAVQFLAQERSSKMNETVNMVAKKNNTASLQHKVSGKLSDPPLDINNELVIDFNFDKSTQKSIKPAELATNQEGTVSSANSGPVKSVMTDSEASQVNPAPTETVMAGSAVSPVNPAPTKPVMAASDVSPVNPAPAKTVMAANDVSPVNPAPAKTVMADSAVSLVNSALARTVMADSAVSPVNSAPARTVMATTVGTSTGHLVHCRDQHSSTLLVQLVSVATETERVATRDRNVATFVQRRNVAIMKRPHAISRGVATMREVSSGVERGTDTAGLQPTAEEGSAGNSVEGCKEAFDADIKNEVDRTDMPATAGTKRCENRALSPIQWPEEAQLQSQATDVTCTSQQKKQVYSALSTDSDVSCECAVKTGQSVENKDVVETKDDVVNKHVMKTEDYVGYKYVMETKDAVVNKYVMKTEDDVVNNHVVETGCNVINNNDEMQKQDIATPKDIVKRKHAVETDRTEDSLPSVTRDTCTMTECRKVVHRKSSPVRDLLPLVHESTATHAAEQESRALSPVRAATINRRTMTTGPVSVDRKSSPVRFPRSDQTVMAEPETQAVGCETAAPSSTEVGVSTVEVALCHVGTSTPVTHTVEKQTLTARVHTINRMIGTETTQRRDGFTSMTSDVASAYKGVTAPKPVTTCSRGTSTKSVELVTTATSPHGPLCTDRSSSPVTDLVGDVTARGYSSAREPQDTFQSVGMITLPFRPVSDAPRSILASIAELREDQGAGGAGGAGKGLGGVEYAAGEEGALVSKASQTYALTQVPNVSLGRRAISDQAIKRRYNEAAQFHAPENLLSDDPEINRLYLLADTPSPKMMTESKEPFCPNIGGSNPAELTEYFMASNNDISECISKLLSVQQRLVARTPSPINTTSNDAIVQSNIYSSDALVQGKSFSHNALAYDIYSRSSTQKEISTQQKAVAKSGAPSHTIHLASKPLIVVELAEAAESGGRKAGRTALARKKRPPMLELLGRSSSLPESSSLLPSSTTESSLFPEPSLPGPSLLPEHQGGFYPRNERYPLVHRRAMLAPGALLSHSEMNLKPKHGSGGMQPQGRQVTDRLSSGKPTAGYGGSGCTVDKTQPGISYALKGKVVARPASATPSTSPYSSTSTSSSTSACTSLTTSPPPESFSSSARPAPITNLPPVHTRVSGPGGLGRALLRSSGATSDRGTSSESLASN